MLGVYRYYKIVILCVHGDSSHTQDCSKYHHYVHFLYIWWYVCMLHHGSDYSLVQAMDGIISSCQSAATSKIVKHS